MDDGPGLGLRPPVVADSSTGIMRRLIKIQNDRHTTHLGRHLLEHLQYLPAHGELAQRESGDVAARPGQARDEPAADWIVDLREDDRNIAGGPL